MLPTTPSVAHLPGPGAPPCGAEARTLPLCYTGSFLLCLGVNETLGVSFFGVRVKEFLFMGMSLAVFSVELL